VLSFTSRPLYLPGQKAPLIGGWVGPRAGLDDVERRKFLYRNSNSDYIALCLIAIRHTDWTVPVGNVGAITATPPTKEKCNNCFSLTFFSHFSICKHPLINSYGLYKVLNIRKPENKLFTF
jgi:hypothetical protein